MNRVFLSILSVEHISSMSFDFFYIFDGKYKKKSTFSTFSGFCRLISGLKSIDAKCIDIFENFDGILSILRGLQNRKYQQKNRPQTVSWPFLLHPLPPKAPSMDLWGLLQVWLYRREVWLLDGVLRQLDIENIENIEVHRKKMFHGLNWFLYRWGWLHIHIRATCKWPMGLPRCKW